MSVRFKVSYRIYLQKDMLKSNVILTIIPPHNNSINVADATFSCSTARGHVMCYMHPCQCHTCRLSYSVMEPYQQHAAYTDTVSLSRRRVTRLLLSGAPQILSDVREARRNAFIFFRFANTGMSFTSDSTGT